MKTIFRAVNTVLGPMALVTLLVSHAAAGCGDVSQYHGPFQMASAAASLRGAVPAATPKAFDGSNSAPSPGGHVERAVHRAGRCIGHAGNSRRRFGRFRLYPTVQPAMARRL